MTSQLTRQFVIRALHNLENAALSCAENDQIYGMCYRLHGHDYHFRVTVAGEIDPRTGLICSRDWLDAVLHRTLIARFEGRNLNDLCENTSGEALCCLFYDLLKPEIEARVHLVSVSLQETRKNWFAYP